MHHCPRISTIEFVEVDGLQAGLGKGSVGFPGWGDNQAAPFSTATAGGVLISLSVPPPPQRTFGLFYYSGQVEEFLIPPGTGRCLMTIVCVGAGGSGGYNH